MAAATDAAGVTVTPEKFQMVFFEADEIAGVVKEMKELLGITNPVAVEVDESTQIARTWAEVDGSSSDAVINLIVECGAIEHSQRLRQFGEDNARLSFGMMLLRARDRMSGDFADAPADEDLSNEQAAAWDTYCVGRLTQLGLSTVEQRWRYNYRNRFGFTDETDATFDRLWAADGLTWDQVLNP